MFSEQTTFYILDDPKKTTSYVPILGGQFPTRVKKRPFTEEALKQLSTIFPLTTSPQTASYLLIPYDYFNVASDVGYLKTALAMSNLHNVPLIIFSYTDFHNPIVIKNALVFRTAQYRHHLLPNEYIIPPIIEDLGSIHGIVLREKLPHPVVGFCGWASYPTKLLRIKSALKNIFRQTKLYMSGDKIPSVHYKGIYFRKAVLKTILRSSLIKSEIIERNIFAGLPNINTAKRTVLREDYVENMQSVDLPLIVRGDGNFSARFYEALSLGKVLLFIDTDIPLPLEEKIAYDTFMLRISYKDVSNIDLKIKEFWENLTNEDYVEMQRKSRECFLEYFASGKIIEKTLASL